MFQFTSLASAAYVFSYRCFVTTRNGFPHSDISGSKLVQQLPEAYRSLPRLSSPLGTKASTVCSSQLGHKTINTIMLNIVVCLYPNCQRTFRAIAPSTRLEVVRCYEPINLNFQVCAIKLLRMNPTFGGNVRALPFFYPITRPQST